jgi:hypothetical protein
LDGETSAVQAILDPLTNTVARTLSVTRMNLKGNWWRTIPLTTNNPLSQRPETNPEHYRPGLCFGNMIKWEKEEQDGAPHLCLLVYNPI